MASNYKIARNLRDRAATRVRQLRSELKATANTSRKAQIKREIGRIHKAVSGTRTYSTKTGKRMHTAAQVQRSIDKLQAMLGQSRYQQTEARNRAFESRIHLAQNERLQGPPRNPNRTVGEEMAGITKAEIKVFYRATQRAWQNVPIEQRNKAILKAYHTQDLEKLFNDVLSKQRNEDVILAQDILQNPQNYTDAMKKWAYETLQDNDDEIRYVPTVVAAVVTDVSPVAPM